MSSLFRSEVMQLSQMLMHTDIAYMCIAELGETGLVQFRDTIPGVNAFQRKFVNEVRRCDEMERKLRFFENELEKDKIEINHCLDSPPPPAPREISDLENIFEKLENELTVVNTSAEQLTNTYNEASELKQILRKTQIFFDEALHDPALVEETVGLLGTEEGSAPPVGLRLGSIAGVINRDRLPAFERMLWRTCLGNVFLKQADIEDPLTDPISGTEIKKSVFLIFFQGEQLRIRVKKICDGFHASVYPCPDSQADRRQMTTDVVGKIQDLDTIIAQTKEHRRSILKTAANNLRLWFVKVRKIKAIYHTLNLFNIDGTTKLMVGECWCAVNDVGEIQSALTRGMELSNSTLQPVLNRLVTSETPPTFHRTNKLTRPFQNIIDAYGVARYLEINPAIFIVITFPFLFGVMFGDIGHGLIMFLFALWMVLAERKLTAKKSDNELWNTLFDGRYIILLMGIFSVYTGLIYNDMFSRSLNIFGSSWYPTYDNATLSANNLLQLNPIVDKASIKDQMFSGHPYPFGVDPIWQMAKNKILFTNSIKMKMSLILGVLQMLGGLFLSFFNHRFFKDKLALVAEFIPQVIFLSSIFLYLAILVFYKWVAYTAADTNPPSLLIGLIKMVSFDYPTEGAGAPFYTGQKAVQTILMLLAFIAIPWLLFAKPLILLMAHRSVKKSGAVYTRLRNGSYPSIDGDNDSNSGESDTSALVRRSPNIGDSKLARFANIDPTKQFNFGETMVLQSIHTIEYVLSCISNTASYLRLWALSLAHSQLSEVLWTMVLHMGLSVNGYHGSLILVFVFAFWALLTVAILIVMEGLSAFLHTLRLHWVEFNSKFYHGDGYPFLPFSFVSCTNLKSDM